MCNEELQRNDMMMKLRKKERKVEGNEASVIRAEENREKWRKERMKSEKKKRKIEEKTGKRKNE